MGARAKSLDRGRAGGEARRDDATRVSVVSSPTPAAHVRARWSAGHALMLPAALGGGLATWSVLARADERTLVLVAARDLAPGEPIDAIDMRATPIAADGATMAHTVASSDAESMVGLVPVVAVREGQLVSPDLFEPTSARARVVSFGVDRARALDADIDVGDRIDVLAARDDGTVGYVLVDVAVLSATTGGGGALEGDGDQVTITAAVDADGALRLASALRVGDLVVVRSTGAAQVPDPQWWQPGEVAP